MQNFKNLIKNFAAVIIAFSLITAASAADSLIPLGHTAGIKLKSAGAIVIGFSDDAEKTPAESAGIQLGDVIKSVNGKAISSNDELRRAVEESSGEDIEISFERNGETGNVRVTPVKGEDGSLRIGVWVRDSIAGIGTLTYLDPENGTYGALGHGISDSDSSVLIPVERGALMKSTVKSVVKGEAGSPGELIGDYLMKSDFADISKNSDCGIFGKITDRADFINLAEYPVADKNEIVRGRAAILSNIDGDEVREYEIEITGIYFDGGKTKNMLVRVTDPELLSKTGGIVRGMSGSPIIQNGKLIGAITHVLVNNPQKGYAIFIENMLNEAEKAA